MAYFLYELYTIYSTVYVYIKEQFMEKVCKVCLVSKEMGAYYPRDRTCKECFNSYRRDAYKKSVCKLCLIGFRPGIRGKYNFCSERCRFLAKVSTGEGDACWLWKGYLKVRGYGGFAVKGKRDDLAHRASFRIFNGSLLDDECVLHSCDNPPCVNPSHLFKGSLKDNSQDMVKKGRGKVPYFRGEKHPNSMLKEENIHEIRRLHKDGLTNKEIGLKFGVHDETIGSIIRNLTWTHI